MSCFKTRIFLMATLLSIIPYFVLADEAKKEPEMPPAPGISLEMLDQMTVLPGNLGALPDVPPVPADNSQTPEKIELGRILYFDKRLSGDKSMSCASCHAPDKGYADALPRAKGFGGQELGRHSPTVLNSAYNQLQFWDGRVQSLEDQAKGPIMAPGEMNVGGEQVMIQRIDEAERYRDFFLKVFGESPNLNNVAKAIAAFERTIVTPDSPFDRYAKGDKKALNGSEKRGLILFFGKANCTACHNGANFSDDKFHVLGVPQAGPLKEDMGRYAIFKDEKFKHAFKTPTVRNAALTAPYMHDGAFNTLEEVVDFYDKGGGTLANKSELLVPLELTSKEKADIVNFLKALTGKLPSIAPPQDA